jgi:hypothetical protein
MSGCAMIVFITIGGIGGLVAAFVIAALLPKTPSAVVPEAELNAKIKAQVGAESWVRDNLKSPASAHKRRPRAKRRHLPSPSAAPPLLSAPTTLPADHVTVSGPSASPDEGETPR